MSPVITARKKLSETVSIVKPFIECPAYRVNIIRKRNLWHASVRYVAGVRK